jgi:hypothetical protein
MRRCAFPVEPLAPKSFQTIKVTNNPSGEKRGFAASVPEAAWAQSTAAIGGSFFLVPGAGASYIIMGCKVRTVSAKVSQGGRSMNRLFRCFGLLLLSLAFLVPTMAAQDKTTDDPKKTDEKKTDEKKTDEKKDTPKAKTKPKPKEEDWKFMVDGILSQIDTKEERDFNVTIKVPEPNPAGQPAYVQAQLQVAQQQMAVARAKDANGRQQALNALAGAQLNLQKAAANLTVYKDKVYKCNVMEGMRVRSLNYLPTVDESTGEFKKPPTKKELEALKGADGYPNFGAQFKDLQVNQAVRVYFAKSVKTRPVPIDPGAAGDRYDVIQVMILTTPPPPKQ